MLHFPCVEANGRKVVMVYIAFNDDNLFALNFFLYLLVITLQTSICVARAYRSLTHILFFFQFF